MGHHPPVLTPWLAGFRQPAIKSANMKQRLLEAPLTSIIARRDHMDRLHEFARESRYSLYQIRSLA